MKHKLKRFFAILMAVCMLFSVAACGENGESGSLTVDTSEAAGDYYLDLTELGMKLTVFLRLSADGTFIFSNTLDFEVNKSSGTFQKSGEEYVMIFESVNGEEKSISDGLTGSFVIAEDGSLDFSGSTAIPYGTANIDTVSAEDDTIKLIGRVVTEDYNAPSSETEFETGSYTSEVVEENGIYYTHVVSFYEDNTYLHFMNYEENGEMKFVSEHGTYGVSTTQLALGNDHTDRVECEVVDAAHLKLSILPYAGATERVLMDFVKADSIGMIGMYTGTGTVTGSDDTFSVELTLYEDGTYDVVADGFTETGILVLNSADALMKQYPDHPETGVRGISQVGTVPSGTVTSDGGVTIADLRVRTSENLTRYACTVME